MRAMIVLWPRLAFGIRLHEKAAEIRNGAIDLVDFRLPPRFDGGIERIGGLETTKFDGRGEARREINLDAVGPEERERRHLLDIERHQNFGLRRNLFSTTPLMPMEASARA